MVFQWVIAIVVMLSVVACDSQTKEEMLRSGIELTGTGNTRGSIVYFRNALEKDPNFVEARYHLANAYLSSGRLDSAENEYKKISLQSSSFPDLPLKLSEIHLMTGRNELAVQALDKYHQENPPTSESLDVQGRSLALAGDFKKSEISFLKAITIGPENPSPKLNLAKTFIAQNRIEEAHKILLTLVEKHQKFTPGYELLASIELRRKQPDLAFDAYRLLYALDASNINALYMQGYILLMSDRQNEAILIVEKLSEDYPADYRTSLLSGLIAYRQGLFENALIDLLKSLKTSNQSLAHYFLGLSYYRLEDLELAISHFQKVLDVNADFSQARLMLAMTLLRQKRIDDCIREVNYVLINDESNGLAYNILGSGQLLRKEYDAAMQSFNRAIEIDPRSVDVYLKKSRTLFARGQTDLAEETLLEALSLSPDVLNARLILASFYTHQENYTEAVNVLHEGLTGMPTDALIYNYLAGIHFKQKNNQEAVSNLQEAKVAAPGYFTPALNLASYYLAKAEYDKAADEYNTILGQDSSNFKSLVGLGLTYELADKTELADQTYERMRANKNPNAALLVAQYYFKSDRLEGALNVLAEALERSPSYSPLYKMKAFLLQQAGKIKETVFVLEQLERLEAGNGYPKLINLLLKQGHGIKAEKIAKNVIQSNPGTNYGYLLLSSIFEHKGQLTRATEVINKGLLTLPGNAGLTLQLGHVHELSKNTPEAINVYQELISNKPNYYPVFFALGALYDRMGNKKEAQNYYQKAITLNSHYVPALNNLAYLYADNYKEKDLALTLSLKAYRLAPEQQDIMDTLGYVLLKNGRVNEAAKILEKANRTNTYNPTISFHLALAYIELSQADKAIAELERSLKSGNFPEAEECKRLLEKLKA